MAKTSKFVSSLSDHILHKKQGVVASPMNNALGDSLKTHSWYLHRMSEYLWLGLILLKYGRNEGLNRGMKILFFISKNIKDFSFPKLSKIFSLKNSDQSVIYNIIVNNIDKAVLAPLTVLYRHSSHPLFNEVSAL
ncbi:hypothetical protein [Desulforapulum autotrophicum]|uniref:hypothetical protein n=1 Tax=Desulforapulum autotrophicum TaxID=2296 RepID=UPI0011D0E119|nr:hypothetical protein [Desulforapulum autotrophicum]